MSARLASRREVPWLTAGAALLAGVGLVRVLGDAYLFHESLAPLAVLGGGVLAVLAVLFTPGILMSLLPATIIFNTRRGFFPFELLILAFAALAALDALRHRDARLHGPAELHLAWLAFLAAGVLTLGLARTPVAFAAGMVRYLCAYAGLALVLRYAGPRAWSWFALSVPVTSIAVGLQLLHAAFSRGFDVRKAFLLRTFFSDLGWGTTNYVGAIVVVCLLGCVALMMRARSALVRLACVAALPLLVGSLALLVSRGTLIAAGFAMALWVVLSRGRGRWGVLLFAGLAVGMLARLQVTQVSLARFQTGSQTVSYVLRVRLWQEAAARFLAHPLLGVGVGQSGTQLDALLGTDPHNFLLTVATEMGIPGILAWLGLAWVLLQAPWRQVDESPARRDWAVALTVFTVVGLAHSCYEPTFPGVQYCFLFFWVYAVLFQGLVTAGGSAEPADGARASVA